MCGGGGRAATTERAREVGYRIGEGDDARKTRRKSSSARGPRRHIVHRGRVCAREREGALARKGESDESRWWKRERTTVKERGERSRTSEQETEDGTEWRYTGREKSGSVPWTTALAYRGSLRSPSYVASYRTSHSHQRSHISTSASVQCGQSQRSLWPPLKHIDRLSDTGPRA